MEPGRVTIANCNIINAILFVNHTYVTATIYYISPNK